MMMMTLNPPCRQYEAMFASIWQLHGVTELDPRPSLGPVIAASRGRVQHLGCGPDLVGDTVVDPLEGAVGDVPHPLQVPPVLGVQLVVAPGVEDVLAVAVEGQVQREVVLTLQQEVPHGSNICLGEGHLYVSSHALPLLPYKFTKIFNFE